MGRLAAVQRWMQAVVVHPGRLDEAVADRATRRTLKGADVGSVILPSRTLAPAERVGIYHGMYLLRMVEALESDYPALQHAMGEDAFRRLVQVYVQKHPSRSYTLNRLGDHLPAFVRRTAPPRRRGYLYDLARLELAVSQVFDAPETESLTEAQIAAVRPEDWERARLTPVDAFRLLALRHPVNAYLQSVRDERHDHPRMTRKDAWVAVWRQDYRIWRVDLPQPAYEMLRHLAAGRPLGWAMKRVLGTKGRGRPTEDQVFRWFREWTSGGAFRAVRVEGRRAARRR
jgi:hypothetical protein